MKRVLILAAAVALTLSGNAFLVEAVSAGILHTNLVTPMGIVLITLSADIREVMEPM